MDQKGRLRVAGAVLLVVVQLAACGSDVAAPVVEGTGPFTGHWDGSRWLGRGYVVLQDDTAQVGGDAGDFPAAVGIMRIERHGDRLTGSVELTAHHGGTVWRFQRGRFDLPVYASWAEIPNIMSR